MTQHMLGIGGHTAPNEGATDDCLTPPEIIRTLGPFDLDPCCPPHMPWGTANAHFHLGVVDGLWAQWFGFVWCNPPYGRKTQAWFEKMAKHNNGIMLTFARTETRMFFASVWPFATSIVFIEGRLHFHNLQGERSKINAGGPSVLIGYGEEATSRLEKCGLGKFVRINSGGEKK